MKTKEIKFPTSSDVKRHKIKENVKHNLRSARSPRAGAIRKEKSTYTGKAFNIPTSQFSLFGRKKK